MSNQIFKKKTKTGELPLWSINPDLAADCNLMELRLPSSGHDGITIPCPRLIGRVMPQLLSTPLTLRAKK